MYKDPESKAEQTVNLLKENILDLKKEEVAKKPVSETKTTTTTTTTTKTTTTVAQAAAEARAEVKGAERVVASAEVDKEEKKTTTTVVAHDEAAKQVDVIRPTLWQRIVKELKHYSDGFKLLYFETKIAYGLLKKVLRGETLTRRERRQVSRN